MSAQVKKLNLNYNGHLLDPLWVILDQHSSPPVLPLLYTTYLCRYGIVYEAKDLSDKTSRKRIKSLQERDVSDNTIRSYVYNLAQFLTYLEHCKVTHQTPGMHASSACSDKFVNHYINQVLASNLDSSSSLNNHRSALIAYFNWLDYMEITPKLDLHIYRKTRQIMAERSEKKHYIQYISKYWRMKLLNTCKTLGEKLMMRMGFEVGLRTSELMGLRVSGKHSLNDLFEKLKSTDFNHVERFNYWLQGRYTKGGKSRWIYFERDWLIDMKRYFETERKWLVNQSGHQDSSFFLRTDQRFFGTGVGEEQASRVFRKRADEAGLNPLLTFHDLRHTFATELFYEEIAGPDGRETRSESAALIVVAQRLGHAFGRDGQAPAVTTRYIRMQLQMQELEELIDG
ncbi:MAG: site-specific integrase [Colwellia sp.]